MLARELYALLPDLVRAGLRRALTKPRVAWRSSFVYRHFFLAGTLANHIAHHPWDATPRRLEDADALLRGRFRFHGESVDVPEGACVFDRVVPSAGWQDALQGFDWLAPLSNAGGEAARRLASGLIAQWIARYGAYCEPAWLAHITARRLAAIFCHGRFVINNSDMMWRSKLFVSLREQARMLERICTEAPDGLPRLEAAAVLALSGICMNDMPRRLETGLKRLETEIARQILPDGGHVSRSPQDLLLAYRYVVMVLEALAAKNLEPPDSLRNAHDRMAPMLRFFRHGDGVLACFQGACEGDARMIAGLLSRDDTRGQPFLHARHCGYQRLTASRTVLLLDCGATPTGDFALAAHASANAFELSSGKDRIVVNCGAGGLKNPNWSDALRATAAHSTLTLADTSCGQILSDGMVGDLLGPRLLGGPVQPVSRRLETAQGWSVEAVHDGYVQGFGLRHARQVTCSPQGLMITGRDRLIPVDGATGDHAYAVRFHIHPDVRVSRLEGGAILLKLPSGEGWRFRAGGADLGIEDSVYLGGQGVRRTEQLVIRGQTQNGSADIAWVFEQISN